MVEAGLIPVLNHPGESARWTDQARRAAGRCRRRSRSTPACAGSASRMPSSSDQMRGRWRPRAHARDEPLGVRRGAGPPAQRAAAPALRARLRGRLRAAAQPRELVGIFLGRAFHYDLCRPGVALYGVNPTPGRPTRCRRWSLSRRPCCRRTTSHASGTVGYGATWRPAGERIVTVPVGYADGYPRARAGGRSARSRATSCRSRAGCRWT